MLVTGVDSGGPAARASLRPNDVLTAFNGTQLSDSDSLDRAVQQSAIGEAASVESWRDGHFRRVSVDPVQAPGHAERADPSE